MKTLIATSLIALLVMASIGATSAWAEGAGRHNPLEKIDTNKRVNTSAHVSENKKLIPKSYSYKTSKVCGLSFCDGKDQKPALQNVWAGGLNAQYAKDFNGHVTIKGHFPR